MPLAPLHIVSLDPWGDALAARYPHAVVSRHRGFSSWPEARCHVVTCAREDVHFFREVDAFAFEWSLTWAPLVLTPRGVRLGPVVAPGGSACYHCFLRRWLQHDKEIGDTRARLRSVADDALRTVSGWLPSDVLIAGGLTETLAAVVDTEATKGAGVLNGTVTSYDGISGKLSRDTVIGVHACPRCRKRSDRNTDTWAGLAREFPPTSAGASGPPTSLAAS